MLIVRILLLIASALAEGLGSVEYLVESYSPSEHEIRRAVQLQVPRESWGYEARKQRNLRLLLVGGSNTEYDSYFVPLHNFVVNSSAHPTWSGSIDRLGIGGGNPKMFGGMYYDFEGADASMWPNVILLEFSVNMAPKDYPTVSEDMDAIIQELRYKYRVNGVPEPDFVFFELFSMEELVMFREKNSDMPYNISLYQLNNKVSEHSSLNTLGRFKGCPGCKEIREVADFYDLPTVSWRTCAFPAFVRYYLTYNGTAIRWPYTREGLHITDLAGELITKRLFTPFFHNVMTSRKELPEQDRKVFGSHDVRLFPPQVRLMQIASYSIWSRHNSTQFSSRIRQPSRFQLLVPEDPHLKGRRSKACYAAAEEEAVLVLDFTAPRECDSAICKASIHVLHSWNETRVGMLNCALLATKTSEVLVQDVTIDTTLAGPGRKMVHTGLEETVFDRQLMSGDYSVRCKKMDSRLTCVGALSILGEVLI